ncbi:hypothetical protein HDU81_010823, partial [Chytriomyces hyalinus]
MTTYEWIAWRWQSVEVVRLKAGDEHLDTVVRGDADLPSVGNAKEEKDKQKQQQQQDAVRLSKALLLYNEASICEREGRLGDALAKYRQATRLEPNIDRMHHVKQSAAAAASAQTPTNKSQTTHSVDEFDENSLQTYYSFGGGTVQQPLLPVVRDDSPHANIRFTPKHAEKPIPIAILPSEIVTHLVKWTLALDFAMLPEIAST